MGAFCLLENVPGIQHRRRHAHTEAVTETSQSASSQSYLDKVLQTIRKEAPMWEFRVWPLNTSDFGLPQNRARVYVVGLNRNIVKGTFPFPPPAFPDSARINILSILNHNIPAVSEVPQRLRDNLQKYTARLNALHACSGSDANHIAVISLDRNPDRLFGEWFRTDGLTGALRTGQRQSSCDGWCRA